MRSIEIGCLVYLLFGAAAVITAQTNRLVNGQNAEVASHPYSASLQRNGQHICGMALIGVRTGVTAAHCVANSGTQSYPPRTFSVRAGSIQRLAGGQLIPVANIIIHKDYANGINDLALVVLQQPIVLDSYTRTIALASEAPGDGIEVTYTGWGSLQTNGPFSHRLQVAKRNALSASDCQKQVHLDDAGLLCLAAASAEAENTSGLCVGDAGAPAVYRNELVGIGSFYVGGCSSALPNGFVNIAHYRDWINENLP